MRRWKAGIATGAVKITAAPGGLPPFPKMPFSSALTVTRQLVIALTPHADPANNRPINRMANCIIAYFRFHFGSGLGVIITLGFAIRIFLTAS